MKRSLKKTIFEVVGRGPVHPFPARMAPGIALEVLDKVKRPLRVLDPMMGSGTVLAVARSRGHRAVGVDIDPLSVLISRVWTTAIDVQEIRAEASEVFDRARRVFAALRVRDAYPGGADEETRRFVTYWFDDYARRQLAALATAIRRVRDADTRDVLWCGFSRLIIAKQAGASLAMDLSHSRPHKSFERAPQKPFRNFLAAVDRVLDNCIDKNDLGRGPAPRIHEGDARDLPLANGSIDLVLTSPPYLNAIDYMRCSKFSLIWMGYHIAELRRLRSNSVGTEVGLSMVGADEAIRDIKADLNLRPRLRPRDEAVLERYIDDMRRAVGEVARVLSPKGRAVYVIGENTTRGTYVRNSVIVSGLAQLAGLKLRERRVRALPANRRYLPPPAAGGGSAGLDGRIRREVILAFQK
jgi:SAM-dependent methyltransferase